MNQQGNPAMVKDRADTQRKPMFRLRPKPPRGLRSSPGSMEATIFWNAPADRNGVGGFRIYRGDESNLIYETKDPNTRQATVKLPGNSSDMCFVATVSEIGRESPKLPVRVQSSSDKYLQNGQPGETPGTSPTPPPEWYLEPSGGQYVRWW